MKVLVKPAQKFINGESVSSKTKYGSIVRGPVFNHRRQLKENENRPKRDKTRKLIVALKIGCGIKENRSKPPLVFTNL